MVRKGKGTITELKDMARENEMLLAVVEFVEENAGTGSEHTKFVAQNMVRRLGLPESEEYKIFVCISNIIFN